ncbi:MAG TPA: glycosyltransferase [Tepidisphaeraceae bacterium]|jgi:glycosyltransferase involved in cell wall biosynthesis|nr:glycosyltransferase [Tepidisphaeraceae bacterium]
MLRALQLLSTDRESSSFAEARGAMMLADNSTEACRSLVLTIGRGGDYRSAPEAAIRLRFAHAFNLVHAWDPPALMAALGTGLPVVFSVSGRMSRGTWSWLAAMAYRDVHVVADSHTACGRLLRAGIPPARCHVIAPGVDRDRLAPCRDHRLREQLGLAAEDRVVLAPGESTFAAGHKLALHATSILHVLDPRYRLLLWGRGREAGSIAWLGRRLRQERVVVDAERRLGRRIDFEQLLGIADLALVTPQSTASALPIALCAAAGLPIIAVDNPLVREILTPQSTAIVPSPKPRLLAQRMMELFENPDAARQLALAAAALGLERFTEGAFVAACHSLYTTLAMTSAPSEPVTV